MVFPNTVQNVQDWSWVYDFRKYLSMLSSLDPIRSITIRLFIKTISTRLMHLLSFCSWIFPALEISELMYCTSIPFRLLIKSEKIALRIIHATPAAIIALPGSILIHWKQQACDKSPQFPICLFYFIHRYNPCLLYTSD